MKPAAASISIRVVCYYLPLFDGCMTIPETENLYTIAIEEMLLEYIIRPEIADDDYYRDLVSFNMYDFTDHLDDYLINESDVTIIWNHYGLFSVLLEDTPSSIEIYQTFIDWSDTLIGLNFAFNEFAVSDFKSYALATLAAEFAKIEDKSPILIDYNDTVNYINGYSNVVYINIDFLFAMKWLHGYVIAQAYDDAENDLFQIYDYYVNTILEAEIPELDVLYQKYLSKIAGIKIEANFASCINEFSDRCSTTFTVVPLKDEIYDAVQNLTSIWESKSETATADSIVAMESVLDNYIILIRACITSEEITNTYNAGFLAMDALYVADPIKVELKNTKVDRINRMTVMLNHIETIFSNFDDTIEFTDQYNQYCTLINQAPDIMQVDGNYQQWMMEAEIRNYPMIANALDLYFSHCENNLYNLYAMIIPDETITGQYLDYIAFMSAQTSIYRVNDIYCQCQSWLESLIG
jgi:hypothetical protein